MQPWNLQARPARVTGYVVVDFPERGYPGMYAASSPLLPESGGSGLTCVEVFGELVDASCLSSEEYDRCLKEVDKLCESSRLCF